MNEIEPSLTQTESTDAILCEFADYNEIAADAITREELLQLYQDTLAYDVLASMSQW